MTLKDEYQAINYWVK